MGIFQRINNFCIAFENKINVNLKNVNNIFMFQEKREKETAMT